MVLARAKEKLSVFIKQHTHFCFSTQKWTFLLLKSINQISTAEYWFACNQLVPNSGIRTQRHMVSLALHLPFVQMCSVMCQRATITQANGSSGVQKAALGGATLFKTQSRQHKAGRDNTSNLGKHLVRLKNTSKSCGVFDILKAKYTRGLLPTYEPLNPRMMVGTLHLLQIIR